MLRPLLHVTYGIWPTATSRCSTTAFFNNNNFAADLCKGSIAGVTHDNEQDDDDDDENINEIPKPEPNPEPLVDPNP